MAGWQYAIRLDIYLFKVNNRITRKRLAICSQLTIKTPECCQWCYSDVFVVNFEHFTPFPCVSTIESEHVFAFWVATENLVTTATFIFWSLIKICCMFLLKLHKDTFHISLALYYNNFRRKKVSPYETSDVIIYICEFDWSEI